MSTTGRRVFGVAACLAAVAAVLVWTRGSLADEGLARRIESEARKGAGTVVRLDDLTDFAWDRVHVFDPYASQATIDRGLGFAWPEAKRTGIGDSDGVALLVFVKDGSVVRYVRQRRMADFAGLGCERGLAPVEAVFVVRPRGDDAFRMVPTRAAER